MQILKEITEWEVRTPNHTYAVNKGGKMVAYMREGTNEWLLFQKPKMFDRRYRKFIKLDTQNSREAREFFEQLETV